MKQLKVLDFVGYLKPYIGVSIFFHVKELAKISSSQIKIFQKKETVKLNYRDA